MNLSFSFQASIIKQHCDYFKMVMSGEIDRLDGCILNGNVVQESAMDGLVVMAGELRQMADALEARADRVIPHLPSIHLNLV